MKIKAFHYITGAFNEKTIESDRINLSKCLIGRHPNCDFILNSPEISRVHGIIIYQHNKYYYIDLASTDGSRINNKYVAVNESSILRSGDVIRIGDFLVLLQFEDSDFLYDSELFTAVNVSDEQRQLTVRCTKIVEETENVKTFWLVAEPPILFNDISFNYKPGQFVILDLEIGEKQIKRPYSISSTPSRPYNLQITVNRVSAPENQPDLASGLVSNWLHDYFKIGDKLKISPPMGDFNYFDNSHKKLLFISAGSGITPLMSMARWLCDTTSDFSVILIYSARTQKDIIFRQELELMAAKYSNFKLAINLTGNDFDLNWTGYRGRLNQTMLLEIAPDIQERIAYACGSESFLESVEAMLREIHYPMHNYYQESFGFSKLPLPTLTPTFNQLTSKNDLPVIVFKKSEQ